MAKDITKSPQDIFADIPLSKVVELQHETSFVDSPCSDQLEINTDAEDEASEKNLVGETEDTDSVQIINMKMRKEHGSEIRQIKSEKGKTVNNSKNSLIPTETCDIETVSNALEDVKKVLNDMLTTVEHMDMSNLTKGCSPVTTTDGAKVMIPLSASSSVISVISSASIPQSQTAINTQGAVLTLMPSANKPIFSTKVIATGLKREAESDSDAGSPKRIKLGKDPVKRPMNAFMVWARQQRPKLCSSMPYATNADISITLGQMWNDLPIQQKQRYYEQADILKREHRRQHPDWTYKPRPKRKKQPTVQTKEPTLYQRWKADQAKKAEVQKVAPFQIIKSKNTNHSVLYFPSGDNEGVVINTELLKDEENNNEPVTKRIQYQYNPEYHHATPTPRGRPPTASIRTTVEPPTANKPTYLQILSSTNPSAQPIRPRLISTNTSSSGTVLAKPAIVRSIAPATSFVQVRPVGHVPRAPPILPARPTMAPYTAATQFKAIMMDANNNQVVQLVPVRSEGNTVYLQPVVQQDPKRPSTIQDLQSRLNENLKLNLMNKQKELKETQSGQVKMNAVVNKPIVSEEGDKKPADIAEAIRKEDEQDEAPLDLSKSSKTVHSVATKSVTIATTIATNPSLSIGTAMASNPGLVLNFPAGYARYAQQYPRPMGKVIQVAKPKETHEDTVIVNGKVYVPRSPERPTAPLTGRLIPRNAQLIARPAISNTIPGTMIFNQYSTLPPQKPRERIVSTQDWPFPFSMYPHDDQMQRQVAMMNARGEPFHVGTLPQSGVVFKPWQDKDYDEDIPKEMPLSKRELKASGWNKPTQDGNLVQLDMNSWTSYMNSISPEEMRSDQATRDRFKAFRQNCPNFIVQYPDDTKQQT